MEKKTLKRVIRAMNSVLNLYDTDFPEELTDIMMEGIVTVADFLNLTETALINEDTDEIDKYLVPEDFEVWLEENVRKSVSRDAD